MMDLSRCNPGEAFIRVQKDNPYPPTGVNLTGLPRRTKDSCADVYNACKRWEKCKLSGVKTIRKIAVLKTDDAVNEVKLCSLCEDLMANVEDLAKIVAMIKAVRKNFEALVRINRLKEVTDENRRETHVPFLTFDVEKYLEMIHFIEIAYCREVELKRQLMKRVAVQNRQALFTFINVLWMHDAFVTEEVTQTVLALVAECGFK